ncbi:hypothetical protein, partial [Yersinia wautersii]|uniref:hypothetical protein n=1 Tax=Yersinia wautersii TaxID=1341643 RepID=UPI001EE2F2B3
LFRSAGFLLFIFNDDGKRMKYIFIIYIDIFGAYIPIPRQAACVLITVVHPSHSRVVDLKIN